MEKMYTNTSLTNVDVLGKVIAKATTDKKPKTRYVKGYMAKPAMAIRKWFGDKIYDTITMSQFK